MKVLIVNNFFAPNIVGGAERSVQYLCEGLVDLGWEVEVVTLSFKDISYRDSLNGFSVNYVKRYISKYSPLNKKRTYLGRLVFQFLSELWLPSERLEFKRVFDTFRPDLVLTNNLAGLGVFPWRVSSSNSVPVVHTLRDYYQICMKQNMLKAEDSCVGQCIECGVATAHRKMNSSLVKTVVGNSKFILDKHLTNGYFKLCDNKSVIFSCCSDEFMAKAKVSVIKDTADDFVFGYIGQLIESKGVALLINQFLLLVNDYPYVTLLIAGDGPEGYVHDLKSLVFTLGLESKVKFLGRVDAMFFMDRVHSVIVPSLWHEPLARVIYESFAMKKFVIASNTGGSPEVIKNGVNGYIFDIKGSSSLLERMKIPLDDKNAYYSICKSAGDEDFSPMKTSLGYSNLFNSVLNKNENK